MMKNITYLGIDLHLNRFNCYFIGPDGEKKQCGFELSKKGFENFFTLVNGNTFVMLEATTNVFAFVKRIKEHVGKIFIGNPNKLKIITLAKKKTDKIDAEKLAVILKMQITSSEALFEPVYIPEEKIQELRSLFTTYDLFKSQIARLKNRIHSILNQNLLHCQGDIFAKKNQEKILNISLGEGYRYQIELLLSQFNQMEKLKTELENKIKILSADYYREIELLTSIKGISVLAAAAILSDIAIIGRFSNSKKLSSYLRSAPGVKSSNETVRNLRTDKCGRKLSMNFISQSVDHFIKTNLKLRSWYIQKINQLSKDSKKGKYRMAVCRKVIAEIFQILKKGEFHRYRERMNHEKKMDDYICLLKRNGIKINYLEKSA